MEEINKVVIKNIVAVLNNLKVAQSCMIITVALI